MWLLLSLSDFLSVCLISLSLTHTHMSNCHVILCPRSYTAVHSSHSGEHCRCGHSCQIRWHRPVQWWCGAYENSAGICIWLEKELCVAWFEVFTALLLKVTVFWYVIPFWLIICYWHYFISYWQHYYIRQHVLTPCPRATQKCVIAVPGIVDGSRISTFSYTMSCTRVCQLVWLTFRFKVINSLMQDASVSSYK